MMKPYWLSRLERRWEVTTTQALIILMVFACTGFTVLLLKDPILSIMVEKEERSWMFAIIYYILILPVYNLILLIYGFVFGQFRFFWTFEKRMFKRMLGK